MVNTRTFNRILDGEYLIGEQDRLMSRAQILLAITTVEILSGTVLGNVTEGAATVGPAVAVAGNAGNGTVGTVTADADTDASTYRVEFYAATKFNVVNGSGVIVGKGTTGVAFDGPINFTITAGGTPFAAGDAFTIPVAFAAVNTWVPLDLTRNDGGQLAAGILWHGRGISTTTQRAVAHVRDCVVNGRKLIWPVGISDNNKSLAIARLAEKQRTGNRGGIEVRF